MKAFSTLLLPCLLCALPATTAFAAPKLTITVTLPSSGVDEVNALSADGVVFAGKKKGKVVTISIPQKYIKGASLYGTVQGSLVGPLVAGKGKKGTIFFSASPKDSKKRRIKKLAFRIGAVSTSKGSVLLSKVPKGEIFDTKYKYTVDQIARLGLTQAGVRAGKRSSSDLDGDGVHNALDVDVDGDGITNIADSTTAAALTDTPQEERPNAPYTSMYLTMPQTVNWHIRGGLSSSEIDAVIGGEHVFATALYFGVPLSDVSVHGAHLVCDTSLAYCRPSSSGTTGTAVYAGFADGDQTLSGRLWSSLLSDGFEYGFEVGSGGSPERTVKASFEPRVGSTQFAPGHTYRIDFTNAAGSVIGSSTMVLPPYFLTVPAVKSFNTTSSASAGDQVINYSAGNDPGMTESSPIMLSSSGDFAGKLRLVFWRLQRQNITPLEAEGYSDFGHLNYGVIIQGGSQEVSCGGLYSELSSTLTEAPSVGQSGSYASSAGALLWPLADSSDDLVPSHASNDATALQNTLSFTVDLSSCLRRMGGASGVYRVALIAAGADLGHGSNRAGQMFSVAIP